MISLKRLVAQEAYRYIFSSLIKASTKESCGLKRFHQLKNVMVCTKKNQEFLRMKLISSKYSTYINRKPRKNDTEKNSAPKMEKNSLQSLEDNEEIMEEDDYEDEDEKCFDNDDDDDDDDDDKNKKELEDSNRLDMFNAIANGDPEILNQLKLLEFEILLMKEMGAKLPRVIKKQHWEELLHLPTNIKKYQYLAFLLTQELKDRNEEDARKYKKEKALEKISKAGFYYYGLSGHSLFYRIYHSSVKKLLNHRQYESNLKILFDCSYEDYMTPRSMKNCAKQIAMTFGDSRFHRVSCKINLCNFNRNSNFGKVLPKYLDESSDIYVDSEKSYLDMYSRNQLIYLSPHASQNLTEINKNYVYIIGSYVDRGFGIKASLAKAKENNIKAAKFPIDFYLAWREGSKAFTLPLVVNILLDMAYYNDWYRAFKNIPSKCHYGSQSRKKINISSRANSIILE